MGAAVRSTKAQAVLALSESIGAAIVFVSLGLIGSSARFILYFGLFAWAALGLTQPDLVRRGRQVSRMSLHQSELAWIFRSGLQLGSTFVLGFDRLCIVPLAALAAVVAHGRIAVLVVAGVTYGAVRASGSIFATRLPKSCGVSPESVGYSSPERWDYLLLLPLTCLTVIVAIYLG